MISYSTVCKHCLAVGATRKSKAGSKCLGIKDKSFKSGGVAMADPLPIAAKLPGCMAAASTPLVTRSRYTTRQSPWGLGNRHQGAGTGYRWSWKPCLALGSSATSLPGLLSIVCSFAKLKLLELKMSMSCVCPQLIPFAFESSNRKIWLPQKMRWGRIICFGHVISACK